MALSRVGWRRSFVWAALTIAFSLLLSQAPLFGVLGFELSLALGPWVGIGAAHLAVGVVQRRRQQRAPLNAAPLFGRALLEAFATLLLPSFLIGLLSTLLGDGCDLVSGIAFFCVGPVCSALWGLTLGLSAALLFEKPRRAYGAFLLWAVFRIIFNIYWFLSEPPIFAYNPLVGYFPGSLYDEQIEVEAPYLWFRLGNFLEAVAVLWIAVQTQKKIFQSEASSQKSQTRPSHPNDLFTALFYPPASMLRLLVLLPTVLVGYFGAYFGFRLSGEEIQKELGGVRQTAHFWIYYPKGSETEKIIELVAKDHEYRYDRLVSLLGEAPEGPIYSYIYSDAEQKHKLFGTRYTQFAKPWLRQIHLNAESFPHRVLQHELAHVLGGSFASWPFRTAGRYSLVINTALIEGFAVAVDWRADDLDPHQWAAAMLSLGLVPPIEALFSPVGFFGKTAGLSYTLSGSFVRFLIDTYGIEPFKVAYETGDLTEAYGKSVSDLRIEWEGFLRTLPLPPTALAVAKARFDRPSIFAKICAHEQASRTAEAYEAVSLGEVEEGVSLLRELCRLEPRNPRHLRAISDVYADDGQLQKAKETLEEALRLPKLNTATAGELLSMLADIELRQGDLEEARRLYSYVYSLHLSDDNDRQIEAKLSSMEDPVTWAGITRYFFRPDDLPGDILLELRELWEKRPNYSLAPYLIGRQLFNRRDYARAVPYLEASLSLGLFGPALTREAIRTLGAARFLSGQFSEASLAFYSLSAGDQPPQTTLEALDWQERLRWEVSRKIEDFWE